MNRGAAFAVGAVVALGSAAVLGLRVRAGEASASASAEASSVTASASAEASGAAPASAALPVAGPVETSPAPGAEEARASERGLEPGVLSGSALDGLPLPKGARVLHVGDSLAGALGLELNRLLRADGLETRLVAETASSIGNWVGGYKVQSQVAQFQPALVLVSLGANESLVLDPALRKGTIRAVVAAIGERPCVWILPPVGPRGRPRLFDVVHEAAAPCVVVETDLLVAKLPRESDGIHPTWSARPAFARVVRRWLRMQRDPKRPGFGLRAPLLAFPTVDFTELPAWAAAD